MLTPIKSGRYISIKADGKLHEKVNKETEGAVLREYELKDGTKGEKWELLYKDVSATITDVKFEDSDFGENILITFTDGENEVILAENTGSNFGTDIMKKLPNVDFSEKLTFAPYAFDDNGKTRKGVSIYQKGDKLMNFFYDAEKKENINGFPNPRKPREDMTKTDWKAYFLEVQVFLTDYTKEHIVPKFAGKEENKVEYPEEEITPESIPF